MAKKNNERRTYTKERVGLQSAEILKKAAVIANLWFDAMEEPQ